MPFVTVESLNKYYQVGTQRIHVLRDLSLAVEPGEMLAIVGASGVGKSTLLHALGGLDTVDSGTIRIGDHELASMSDAARVEFRNRNVGFVFQFHHLLPEFSALENVEMPMRIAREPLPEVRAPRDGAPDARRSCRAAAHTGRACCQAGNSSESRSPGRS